MQLTFHDVGTLLYLSIMKTTVGILLLLVVSCAYAADEEKGNKTCDKENCPWPVWNHYEAKGCTPIIKNGECCPSAFNCSKFLSDAAEDGCQFKGQFYKQGETINTTNPCHKCRCAAKGITSCTISECFIEMNLPNCFAQFVHTECCPTSQFCVPVGKKSLEEVADVTTCKWEGKTYIEGQIVELKGHPCLTCICNKDFKGPNSPSCKKVECSFPGNNLKMKRGCVPVYMNNRCCSIDWICPPGESEIEEKSAVVEGGCQFGARSFPLGASLELRDPCINCNCSTPPDFTCIRTLCPPPPNFNCHPIQPQTQEPQCCHEFRCTDPKDDPRGPLLDGHGPPIGLPPQPEQ